MEDIITLSCGNGGVLTSRLIEDTILTQVGNQWLNALGDGAVLKTDGNIAFSTDSFVIDPHFFPGGDIGKLSVCGTVNDLLMCGSIPKFLSLSLILEEGFPMESLKEIMSSIAATARTAGVSVVTGDTKVVEKGHGDGIYINTSGIGCSMEGVDLGKHRMKPGDKVLLTGNCGDHGVAVLCAREGLLEGQLKSDCTPLNEVVKTILEYKDQVKMLRDPTRGGVATTLNELVENTGLSIEINEKDIPVDEKVKGACRLLGVDPLYSANEGKAIAIVDKEICDDLMRDLRKHDESREAAVIGEVKDECAAKVVLRTEFGGGRILGKLVNHMLPRIC